MFRSAFAFTASLSSFSKKKSGLFRLLRRRVIILANCVIDIYKFRSGDKIFLTEVVDLIGVNNFFSDGTE